MMDKSKLRGADFITSLFLMGFGTWVLFQTFQMPMKDTYGGVINVWYVSPALFPLFIGSGIILLSLNIFLHSLKNGGFRSFQEWIRSTRVLRVTEKGYRFLAILVPLLSLVYMNLPRIDFFLSILFFLLFFIPVFYFDDHSLLKTLLAFYSIEMAILLTLFLTGMDALLLKMSRYALDIIALGMILALYLCLRRLSGAKQEHKRKLKHALIISLAVPSIIVPAFRFFLRVPLPKEGGIVDLFFLVYYAIR